MMIKNIVFDLAGVVFDRNDETCPREIIEFFNFVHTGEPLPKFWNDYDRGVVDAESVAQQLAELRQCDMPTVKRMMLSAIEYQAEIPETRELIIDLKAAGYRLFVLSNMSKDYIAHLRRQDVYKYFEGDVVSCETHTTKPEREIYATLLEKFSLRADETLFMDDRPENVEGAVQCGICGFHFLRLNPAESCRQLRDMLLK